MSDEMARLTGACLCGAVEISVTGAARTAGNCHCRHCQKISGTGHIFHLMFDRDDVSVRGKTSAYTYVAESGNRVESHFCPNCGSPLFGHSSGYPNVIAIRAAVLDDSSAFRPKFSVHVKNLQPWDATAEGVPAFPESPPAR